MSRNVNIAQGFFAKKYWSVLIYNDKMVERGENSRKTGSKNVRIVPHQVQIERNSKQTMSELSASLCNAREKCLVR